MPTATAIDGPRLLRLKEAAAYLGTTEGAVRRLVRRRDAPFLIIGHRYLIDRLDLDRYVEKKKLGVAEHDWSLVDTLLRPE